MNNVNLATPGLILKGRHDSNPQRRTKVWALHPTNPKRVLLWSKGGRFTWASVFSLETNYEAAPADEPTWPDPTHQPPPDPKDAPKTTTPVENIAAAPEPAPTVDTSEPVDDQGEETPPEVAPPAPIMPPVVQSAPESVLTVTLRGDTAQAFRKQLALINNAAALTGGSPLSADDLVGKAVHRLVSQVMGGAL